MVDDGQNIDLEKALAIGNLQLGLNRGEFIEDALVPRHQYIGFRLGKEEFLLNIYEVQEIRMLPEITMVPLAHPLVEGVINLRGEILPCINLRRFLTIPQGEKTSLNRVIVCELEDVRAGLIIDEITRVFSLSESDIEPVPSIFSSVALQYLAGVSKFENKINAVIEIKKLLRSVAAAILSFHSPASHVSC